MFARRCPVSQSLLITIVLILAIIALVLYIVRRRR
jgi:hypothetical protein